MNYETAWQAVLGQLQTEMPHASFDTWVRSTKAISYEDGVLTVAAPNAYARDWLEGHLASTINHVLVDILSTSVCVNFVVAQDGVDDLDRVEVETDTSSNLRDEEQLHDDMLDISPAAFDSAYEQIVRPDRAVYLPGYFRRWLRSLGPDLGWMYISFRQAAYLAGARTGSQSSRFSGKQLASMCGISERTYWNRVNNPATWQKLSGLVMIIEGEAEWVKGAIPRRLPRRYTIAMTLPLTPVDTNSLRQWITSHIEAYAGVEGVLRAAIVTSLDELLPLEAQPRVGDQALTVRGLLHDLFKGELADGLLDSLASALQSHIMPQNDLIVVSLFFIEHILPHLDAGPGWMLVLLRDMCYVNPEDGEVRNRVTVRGGYAEIAGWLGMSRPKTIWEWFNERNGTKHEEPGMFKNPIVRVYMREVTGPKSEDFIMSPRTFDVLIEDLPHEILEAALTDNFAALTGRGADFTIGMTPLADHRGATFSIVVARFSHYLGAIFSIVMARLAHDRGATCTVKSSLTLKTNSLNPPTQPRAGGQKTTETEQLAIVAEQSGGRDGWPFSEIAQQNSLNPKGRRELHKYFTDEQVLSQKFLAWILYAYSPQGKGLIDTTGVSKAIKSLCSAQPDFAPRNFERLTKLGPQKLQELFDRDYAREELGKSSEAKIYEANFKNLNLERKSDLYFRLFGKDNPEPAAKPKKIEQPKTFLELQKEKVRAEREARQKQES
jgi:hypothetical protein